MESPDLNVLAIVVAAIFAFGFGSLWYSPVIFGKRWARLTGQGEGMGSPGPRQMVTLVIIALISAVALAAFVSWSGATSAGEGALIGVIVAVGFLATMTVNMGLFERRSLELYFINNLFSFWATAPPGRTTSPPAHANRRRERPDAQATPRSGHRSCRSPAGWPPCSGR